MKNAYWDTSLILKLYVQEGGSQSALTVAGKFERIVVSIIAQAEIPLAFHRKVREGEWVSGQIKAALRQIDLDISNGVLSVVPLTGEIWNKVRAVYEQAPAKTFLRAPDAIHLATCVAVGFNEIYTNDRHQLAAASLFGLKGLNPIPA